MVNKGEAVLGRCCFSFSTVFFLCVLKNHRDTDEHENNKVFVYQRVETSLHLSKF